MFGEGLLLGVGKWFLGKGLDSVVDGYKAKLASGNTTERIYADLATKELAVNQKQSELNAQIVLAEQGKWYTAWIRPAGAVPIIAYLWKAILWDKVIMSQWLVDAHTDPLDGQLGDFSTLIIGTYYGGRTIEKAARILSRK